MNTIFSIYENISDYFWPIPNTPILDFDEEAPTIQKLDSIQVRVLQSQLQKINSDKTEFSLEEFHNRVRILNTITQNIVLEERTWYFHIITLGVSYLFLKLYDQWQANKILQEIEQFRAYCFHFVSERFWHLIGDACKFDKTVMERIAKHPQILGIDDLFCFGIDSVPNTILIEVLYNRNIDEQQRQSIVSFLIAAGANPNTEAPQSACSTPLLNAVYLKQPQMVELLIAAKADIEAEQQDYCGETPLVRAVHTDPQPEIVEILLKAGADKSKKPYFGRFYQSPTILDYAKKYASYGNDCEMQAKYNCIVELLESQNNKC